MNSNDLRELMRDDLLLHRVALENLAVVALGLRSCSQTTIPAELPSGLSMGASIDERFKPRVEVLKLIQNPKQKTKAVFDVRRGMANAFEEIVEGSKEYEALASWARKLGLKTNQVEVRPTVHEFYMYKDKETLKELQELMRERGRLRIEAFKRPIPNRGQIQFAYPEEFNSAWIRRMGRLLGYPDCCVDRYALDREQGVNAEVRAAKQLKELGSNPDSHVYLASYFFPCSPTCEKARQKGEIYHQKLTEALPQAGEAYTTIISENMDRVRRQPEIIEDYLSKLRGI